MNYFEDASSTKYLEKELNLLLSKSSNSTKKCSWDWCTIEKIDYETEQI